MNSKNISKKQTIPERDDYVGSGNKFMTGRVSNLTMILSLLIAFSINGCKKAIEVDPPSTNLNAGNVFTTDATAAAVLTNIYAEMSAQNINLLGQDITSVSLFASLGADELVLYNLNNQNLLDFYRNDLTVSSQPRYWNAIYLQIFAANNAIEGLNASNSLTPAVKQQLLGEAKFIRAFCYFYLVNMYGDVPMVLNLDWNKNALLARSSKTQVYQQIIADLKEAQTLLSDKYLKSDMLTPYATGAEERVRPSKWAATAMLARVYLYAGTNDWMNAETEATKLINNSSLFTINLPLNSVFLKNSKETIWALQPVGNNANSNTGEGKLFILPAGGPNTTNNPVYLSTNVVNAFETGDIRKTSWVDSVKPSSIAFYYAKKYKIGNVVATTQEYPVILRLAEQYLIRAEARAQQNNLQGAIDDLDKIRQRANLPLIAITNPGISQAALLDLILHERQVEFFTEWGHRWFDLKRIGNIDVVMNFVAPIKGSSWSSFKALYPIPQSDIDKNPNLVQNQGY